MVDPGNVDQPVDGAKPLNPPAEAVLAHPLPVVERVAPELPGRAEVIRRHSGNLCAPPPGVELELRAIGPDVGAIVGDEDRDIAEDQHASLVGVASQRGPLPVERELSEGDGVDLGGQPLPGRGKRSRLAQPERRGPIDPARLPLLHTDRHKQAEIVQPAGLLATKRVEGGTQLLPLAGEEALGSQPQRGIP